MDRRDFLLTLGAGAGTWLSRDLLPAGRLERVGLELYAVRKAMRANPEATLEAIAAIGYAEVELLWSFNNFGRTKEQVRDALRKAGLKASSAHMAPETILRDWDMHLDTAAYLGQQYLVAPSLPAEAGKSLDVWKLWAERFNAAGEVARRHGIWLALHNEPNDQKPLQGEVPFDVFVRETDPKYVRIQLDVGNMLMGGGDPMAFLDRNADRCWSFHIKNVVADRKRDTELAAGIFDLKAFLARIPKLGDKPCFVEQEGPADELASARANYEYLRGLRW
ncbi:MAG: sugar phosphate isomerase/epimerase [Gemmatimonadetes bacterium]|nr:sugar phosphate isomerase/epimerase [Gemmatimonadota bacterium]